MGALLQDKQHRPHDLRVVSVSPVMVELTKRLNAYDDVYGTPGIRACGFPGCDPSETEPVHGVGGMQTISVNLQHRGSGAEPAEEARSCSLNTRQGYRSGVKLPFTFYLLPRAANYVSGSPC